MDEEIERLRDVIDNFIIGVQSISEFNEQRLDDLKKSENVLKAKDMVLTALQKFSEQRLGQGEESNSSLSSFETCRRSLDEHAAKLITQQAACSSGILNSNYMLAKAADAANLHSRISAMLEIFDKVLYVRVQRVQHARALREELVQHKEYVEERRQRTSQPPEIIAQEKKLYKKVERCNIMRHVMLCFIHEFPEILSHEKYLNLLEDLRAPITDDNIEQLFDRLISRRRRDDRAQRSDKENEDSE